MRIRSIKPEFYRDEITGAMVCEVALFYLGLCGFADDAGCFEWNPRLMSADLDPYGAKWDGPEGIERQLANLVALRRIVPYEVGGRKYGRILSFRSHQKPRSPVYTCPKPADATLTQHCGNAAATLPLGVGGGEGEGYGGGEGGAEPAGDGTPVVVVLPCVGEGPQDFSVTEHRLASWAEAYPGLDVRAEARKMRLWLEANPVKRKTHRGMPRFFTNWLSRAQDRGGARHGYAPQAVIAGGAKFGAPTKEDDSWNA